MYKVNLKRELLLYNERVSMKAEEKLANAFNLALKNKNNKKKKGNRGSSAKNKTNAKSGGTKAKADVKTTTKQPSKSTAKKKKI